MLANDKKPYPRYETMYRDITWPLTCKSGTNRSRRYNATGTVYKITRYPGGNRRWGAEVGNRKRAVRSERRGQMRGSVQKR